LAYVPNVITAVTCCPTLPACGGRSSASNQDTDELGELFTDDAEFVNIMGMRMRRRQGVVDDHGWAFAGPLRGRRVHFDQVDESVSPMM
jgi:hypothetical protein